MPKYSLVIPVYNVEPYLRECLDSVCAQSLADLEVICVDDGSPDNSGAILDEYAKKDSRFRVIHQKNAGASAARNRGLDLANGQWISFIDADDVIDKNYLKVFDDLPNKADVTFFNVASYDETNKMYIFPKTKILTVVDNCQKLYTRAFNEHNVDGFGWTVNKFIRAKYAKKVHFITSVRFCEDELYALQLCNIVETFQFIEEQLYKYRTNTSGLSWNSNRDCPGAIKAFLDVNNTLKYKPLQDIVKERIVLLVKLHAVATGAFTYVMRAFPFPKSLFLWPKFWLKAQKLPAPIKKFYRFLMRHGEYEQKHH